jgi:hypothetical protein
MIDYEKFMDPKDRLIYQLRKQNEELINYIAKGELLKNPPPIIFCNECPNINRDSIKRLNND